jgi:ABC-2 type transport system permease protein
MIFVAAQAPASVSRDLRFRVVSLYFSRPMRRVDYVLAKYAALATGVFALVAVPLTILFAGALLAKMPVRDQVPDYLRALAGAVLLAVLLAGLGLLVAALTPKRGLGVAAIIALLTILIAVQHVVEAIATDQGSDTVAGYAGLISPFALVDGVQHSLLGAGSDLLAHPPGVAGGLVFLGVGGLLIAGSFGALLLRYRKVSI